MKAEQHKAICRWKLENKLTGDFNYGFELFDSISSFQLTENTKQYHVDDIVRVIFSPAYGYVITDKGEL